MFRKKFRILIVFAIFLVAISSFASCCVASPITGFDPKTDSKSLMDNCLNMKYGQTGVESNGVYFSSAQIEYALAKSISMIASGNANTKFNIPDFRNCENSHGDDLDQTLSKSQYVDMANRYSNWTENHGQLPNYVGINVAGVPDISNTKALGIWLNVLSSYHETGQLPESVSTAYY